MPITSFIPKVWEAGILMPFQGKTIAEMVTTPPIEISGNEIVFNKLTAVTVGDYVKASGVTFQEADTTSVSVLMNRKRYFAVTVDSVDKVQARSDLMTPLVQDGAYRLAEDADKFVLGLITAAKVPQKVETAVTATIGNNEAYDMIVKANVILNKNNVPTAGRYALVSYDTLGLLSLDSRFTTNYKILENGLVEGATVNGVPVIATNNLPTAVEGVVLQKGLIGYGKQLQQTDAGKHENKFGEFVKSLLASGAEVLRPECGVRLVKKP